MNNKKKVKQAYLDVNVSSDLERKILNMTINKEVKKRKFKLAYLVLIAVVITGFSLSFAYAKEIKEAVQKIFSLEVSKNHEDLDSVEINVGERGITRDIPDTFKRSEKKIVESKTIDAQGNIVMKDGKPVVEISEEDIPLTRTIGEIEKDLGFPILKYKNNDKTEASYTTDVNKDGTICRVWLWIPDFYEKKDKYCVLHVMILDDNADSNYFITNPNDIDTGEKIDEEIYHTDNIKEDILIYSMNGDSNTLRALFYHDGIRYQLEANAMTRDEFKTLLDNLKY